MIKIQETNLSIDKDHQRIKIIQILIKKYGNINQLEVIEANILTD